LFAAAVSAFLCSRETGPEACAEADSQHSVAAIVSAATRIDFEDMALLICYAGNLPRLASFA
jgi:hypothetical protein